MLIILQDSKFVSKKYLPKETSEKIWINGKNNGKIVQLALKNNHWNFLPNNKIIRK